jgi:hypothetical protein
MGWGRVPHTGVPKIVTRPHPIRGHGAVLNPPFAESCQSCGKVLNQKPLVNNASLAKLTTQVCEGMRRVTIFGTPL